MEWKASGNGRSAAFLRLQRCSFGCEGHNSALQCCFHLPDFDYCDPLRPKAIQFAVELFTSYRLEKSLTPISCIANLGRRATCKSETHSLPFTLSCVAGALESCKHSDSMDPKLKQNSFSQQSCEASSRHLSRSAACPMSEHKLLRSMESIHKASRMRCEMSSRVNSTSSGDEDADIGMTGKPSGTNHVPPQKLAARPILHLLF